MVGVVENLLTRHRLTVSDYYRMGEVGILRPDARVELIEGEIIDMAPKGSRHAGAVELVAAVLRREVGTRAMVRTQQPISLDEHSEPEPDITVVLPRDDYYASAHPGPADLLLVVEVADTSLSYDRETKIPLYARHGLVEARIVDLEGRRVMRYRSPCGGAYTRKDVLRVDRPVGLDAIAGVEIDLSALLAS